ncbi:MAG TPA: hypothetical protein VJN96_26660 [Vicinamibacterales bacterium]|nr:hypothetical protein [Vicinamibacterales bacterium]
MFVAFAALYITAAPSLAWQHWDSLEYARACETRGPLATWGNHPLGQLIQCSGFRIAVAAGVTGRALPVLAIATALSTGGAVAAFFLLLVRALRVSTLRALGWSAVLGSAYGLWHYAGTADIYGISLLFLIPAWEGVLRTTPDEPASRDRLTIAFLAVAALIHQYNVVLLATGIAALMFVRPAPQDRARLRHVSMWSFALATLGYLVLGTLSLPAPTPLKVLGWIIGYGDDPTYGRSFGLRGLPPALHSIAETFLKDPYLDEPRLLWGAVVALGILLFVAGVVLLRRASPRDRWLPIASAAQLTVGWALIVWWWPLMYGKWWLQTLPILILWWDRALEGLLIRLGTSPAARVSARLANGVPLAVGAFALVFNFQVALSVERQPDRGFEQGLALWVAHSQPDDLLIENGRLTAHLLFWSDRPHAMNVYRVLQAGARTGDPLGAVRRAIDAAIANHQHVLFGGGLDPYFFTDDILHLVGVTRADLTDVFERYRHEGPMFVYQEWPSAPPTPVYRLQLPDRPR